MSFLTIEEAGHKLQAILAEITDTTSDTDSARIQGELIQLKKDIPFDAEFATLRSIASDTFDDLNLKLTATILQRIHDRSGQLDSHVHTIVAVTKQANADSQQLKLAF